MRNRISMDNLAEETKKGLPKIDLKAKGDRVIIYPLEMERKTPAGIIIPDTAKEEPLKGIVIDCGPGDIDHPMTVSRGQIVAYGKYAGTEYEYKGEKFLLMRVYDISADVVKEY